MKYERLSEDEMIIRAWDGFSSSESSELIPLLVLAPRHPQRFAEVEALVAEYTYLKATGLRGPASTTSPDIVLLDTIGDLASVYNIADVAFVGGSLVPRGGHNPLEPAQFGVPVVMGPSYQNFRDIVARMRAEQAIMIVQNSAELEASLSDCVEHRGRSAELGRRGQAVFERQQGATTRTVEALKSLLPLDPEARR
jgi:3-deoxy-D-manno-octulosonic-acid transferase